MTTKHPNILFSTTRSWNPGDDFILFGIKRLLSSLIGQFNTILYDHNPELNNLRLQYDRLVKVTFEGTELNVNFYQTLNKALWHINNSWQDTMNINTLDAVIFAGNVEWLGNMVEPLTSLLKSYKKPILYLGIGTFEKTAKLTLATLPQQDRHILQSAQLIVSSDDTTANILTPLPVKVMPSPALYSAMRNTEPRKKISRLAISMLGRDKKNSQRGTDETDYTYFVELIDKLSKHYQCELVAHYIWELIEYQREFGERYIIHYAYDARDYINIYNQFDCTITSRIHGAGLCASLGIPSFVVSRSIRRDIAKQFHAEIIDPHQTSTTELADKIKRTKLKKWSKQIIHHRDQSFQQYIEVLKSAIPHFLPQ